MPYSHNKNLTPFAKDLRKNMTPEERKLWYCFLRRHPQRFLRQKVIDNYIVDFYCSKASLAIELDGSQHYEPDKQEHDLIRSKRLAELGVKVLRIPNNEINRNFQAVCEYIELQLKALIPH